MRKSAVSCLICMVLVFQLSRASPAWFKAAAALQDPSQSAEEFSVLQARLYSRVLARQAAERNAERGDEAGLREIRETYQAVVEQSSIAIQTFQRFKRSVQVGSFVESFEDQQSRLEFTAAASQGSRQRTVQSPPTPASEDQLIQPLRPVNAARITYEKTFKQIDHVLAANEGSLMIVRNVSPKAHKAWESIEASKRRAAGLQPSQPIQSRIQLLAESYSDAQAEQLVLLNEIMKTYIVASALELKLEGGEDAFNELTDFQEIAEGLKKTEYDPQLLLPGLSNSLGQSGQILSHFADQYQETLNSEAAATATEKGRSECEDTIDNDVDGDTDCDDSDCSTWSFCKQPEGTDDAS